MFTSCKEKNKKIKRNIFKIFFIQRICALQETQSLDIHDILNAQEFALHYNATSIWKFSPAKQKDGLLMFSVLETKIFQHDFLEEQV